MNGTTANSSNGINGHASAANTGYTVTQEPLGTIKPLRIVCIGAGASGINMAYQAKHYLKNVELVVYEKNADIGGTWYENRYPGCKCDIRKSRVSQILACDFTPWAVLWQRHNRLTS